MCARIKQRIREYAYLCLSEFKNIVTEMVDLNWTWKIDFTSWWSIYEKGMEAWRHMHFQFTVTP